MTPESDNSSSVRKENLPFEVGSKQELLNSIVDLESKMTTEPILMEDWLKAVYASGEKWKISPETSFMANLATLYLAEKSDDLVMGKVKEKALANWEKYSEREKRAYERLQTKLTPEGIWKVVHNKDVEFNETDRKRIERVWVTNNDTEPGKVDETIWQKAFEFLEIRKETYLQRSENRQRRKLIRESLNSLVEEMPQSTAKIGRVDKSFFETAIESITLISSNTINYKAPLMIEEPGYMETYREKHPIGIIILPYYVDEKGDYYLYVVPRNEPGALKHSVLAAGEQTSLTKMTGGDILKQPGGAVLSVCAQEFGSINCEGVPELREELPLIKHIIAYGNTNRLGGGFKVYATAKLEKGSSLFERYKGKWFNMNDLTTLLEETKSSKPIINELLGNCLFVLQSERVELLEKKVEDLQRKLFIYMQDDYNL